jgi:hypothetical protein
MIKATNALSSSEAHDAYRRALNKVGDKARTLVKRELSAQTGLSQKDVVKYGAYRVVRANYGSLAYRIVSTGSEVPLRAFRAVQGPKGVRASPWGERQLFESAFIYAGRWNSGKPVGGGHVYKRIGAESLPIEKLYGPSVPKEMVKGATLAAWQSVAAELPARVAHEVTQLTNGVVSGSAPMERRRF